MENTKHQKCWRGILLLLILLACTSCGGKDISEDDTSPETPVIVEPTVEAEATTMSLVKTEGTVHVQDDSEKDVPLLENMGLYSGYHLETQTVSYAWINLDSVKLAKMDESSKIELQKDDKKLEILLKAGSIFFRVTEPLKDGETMNIRTSTMSVGIRGTCGWVEENRVYILEGSVEVMASGETAQVSAGEMAEVSVTESGETEITVQPYAEEYVAPFALVELEADTDLSAAVLEASGLDVLNPSDPVERLMEEYREIIAGYPVMDPGVAEGVSYIRGGVTYASEGLTHALYVDLDGNGEDELVLITERAAPDSETSWSYITGFDIYQKTMGHIRKLDEMAETEVLDLELHSLGLIEKDARIYLSLGYGEYDESGFYTCGLENGRLALSEDYSWSENNVPEYTQLNIQDYMGEPSVPKLSNDVQRKILFQSQISSPQIGPPVFAKLFDINGDGVEDLVCLYGNLYAYVWDGSDDLQYTPLENDYIRYAKLIDMDQNGTEELLLITYEDERYHPLARVYSFDNPGTLTKVLDIDYNEVVEGVPVEGLELYRDKQTGNIFIGRTDNPWYGADSRQSFFHSLTEFVHLIFDGTLSIEAQNSPDGGEQYLEQRWNNYETQMERFEKIEEINLSSSEWEDSLRHTVEEVLQQLSVR